jgi:hypothetical protein
MLKDAAAYFFDQTDYFLLNYFEDDVREAYEVFKIIVTI